MYPKEALEKLETEMKLRGHSNYTSRNYSFFIQKFLVFLGKENGKIDDKNLNEEQVKKYLSSLTEKSRGTLMLATSALKFFFTEILKKPFSEIKLPKKEKKLPTVLTKEEIKKIIENAETEKSKLMISLLYSSGLRVSELVNLKPEDLNLKEKTGLVRNEKGSKDRIFTLSEKLSEQLTDYIEKNKNNEYLFSKSKPLTTRNIQKIVKKLAKKCEIEKKITPHTFRNSFATHLFEQGIDNKFIQALLGHENLQTTQIYTHISNEQLKKIKNPLDNL